MVIVITHTVITRVLWSLPEPCDCREDMSFEPKSGHHQCPWSSCKPCDLYLGLAVVVRMYHIWILHAQWSSCTPCGLYLSLVAVERMYHVWINHAQWSSCKPCDLYLSLVVVERMYHI